MIPLFKIHQPDNIGAKLQEVFDSGFLTEGSYSDQFEKDFSDFIGNPNVCLTNSCTSAMEMSALLINLKSKDEVYLIQAKTLYLI